MCLLSIDRQKQAVAKAWLDYVKITDAMQKLLILTQSNHT